MAIPKLSDITTIWAGKNINKNMLNNAISTIVGWLTDGTTDLSVGELKASSYVGLPSVDFTAVAGESIVAGNGTRLHTDGKLYKTDNTSTAGVKNFLGFAKTTVTTGDSLTVNQTRYESFSGLTIGSLYYLSTSGTITVTNPGLFIRPVGEALTATTIELFTDLIPDIFKTSITGLAASATQTQAAGTLIKANSAELATVITEGDAFTIDIPAIKGTSNHIKNNASNLCKIFPKIGDTIEGHPINEEGELGGGDDVHLHCFVTGTWTVIGKLIIREIDTGDWNMNASTLLAVAHGITPSKARETFIQVRNDAGTIYYFGAGFNNSATGEHPHITCGIVDSTDIKSIRLTGGLFDSTDFDSIGYNRGVFTIKYKF